MRLISSRRPLIIIPTNRIELQKLLAKKDAVCRI